MKKVREGYKRTELGEIPQEWNVISFFDFIEKIIDFRGRTPKKLGMDWGNGNIVALSANNVKMGKIDFNLESYYASEELYEKWMSGNELSKGDILMTMEAPLGNIAVVPDNNKYILSQRVVAFKTKDFINNTFMKYMLMSDIVQSQLATLSTGTTAKGINQKNLAKAFVIIPTLKEQEKIASIISTLDEQIDNIDALIEKNKELKKGLMQTLLTKGIGHTKFKKTEIGEIPEEWEVRILGDIVEFSQGIQVSLEEQYDEDKYGYERFLRIIDYTQKSKEYRYIKYPGERYLVKNNDVVMVRYGATAGFVGTGLEGAIANNMFKITPNREVLLREFLYVYLNQDNIFKSLNMATGASAMPAINFGIVSKLNIVLPSIYEQKKITSILFEVDKNLEEYENKKQKLEELKKGLMQKLLTGSIRVF